MRIPTAVLLVALLATSRAGAATTKTNRPTTTRPPTTALPQATTPPIALPLRIAPSFPPRAGLSIFSDDAFLLTRLGVTETLVRADSSGKASPMLATSWRQVTSTTWQFTLRAGVTFHDGQKLDASAVANSLTKAVSSASPPRALRGIGLSASAISPLVVEVATTRPDPIVPLRLTSPGSAILSPSAYGMNPPSAIGSGIYRVDSYKPNDRIELRARSGHWSPKVPSIDRVTVRLIADPAARASALRAGEIDLAEGIAPAQLSAVKSEKNLDLLVFDLPRTTTLYLNTTKAPFDNIKIRRAVDLAIDRATLASQLLEGAARPAAGYFGPAVEWDPDVKPPTQNLDEARRLADNAQLPKKIRLWTYPARAELPELAVAIKDMLGRAGIDVEITIADYNGLEPEVLGGRHDMFLLSRSYMVDIPDPAAFLSSDFTCNGSYNLNRFCDPRLDAELFALGFTSMPSARVRAFASVARQLDLDVVGVPILHDQARIGFSRKLSGLVADPLEQRLLSADLRLAA